MLLLAPFLMCYSILATLFPNFQEDFLGTEETPPPEP